MTTEEIVWEEIDRVRKVNTALAEMLRQKELDAAYWKQRCESAERVLIKYSHRIPDSTEFMDWQSTTDKTPAQPVENKSAVWVKAAEPFVKMYNALTETKKRQGGNIFGFNNAWITVEDLANISKVCENSGASQLLGEDGNKK